jgi:arylformamidase
MHCSVHTGTHVDAPAHFVAGGTTVEKMPMDVLMGPAYVADLGDTDIIDAGDLERAGVPLGVERLLMRTRNSRMWHDQVRSDFREDFVGLAAGGAQWIVERHIRLVGIDYLSIQPFGAPADTHIILLGEAIVILEGLDLSGVRCGAYELCCLPLKLVGAEGAPARAVLWKVGS